MKAIVVSVVNVDCVHSLFKFLVGNDFTNVFKNEHTRFELVAAPYSPSFFFRHKTFQTLCPAMTLDSLVHALVAHWTHLAVAFCIYHSVKAVITTALSLGI
jgi:hypothetical protein